MSDSDLLGSFYSPKVCAQYASEKDLTWKSMATEVENMVMFQINREL